MAAVRRVLAGNPGPMTLDGTNTWLIGDPDADDVLVVDPGPLLKDHLDALREAAGGRRVAAVLLTHGHPDHAEAAEVFATSVGCGVHAAARLTPGTQPLPIGGAVTGGGAVVTVVATPGHSPDSVSFLVEGAGLLLTGDTVLGRGTSMVDHPEGSLRDYLASLARIQALVADGAVTRILPGHGPEVADPERVVAEYLRHRAERLAQVRAAVAAGAESVDDVLDVVYADIDPLLRPAAARSVAAQLAYLAEDP